MNTHVQSFKERRRHERARISRASAHTLTHNYTKGREHVTCSCGGQGNSKANVQHFDPITGRKLNMVA